MKRLIKSLWIVVLVFLVSSCASISNVSVNNVNDSNAPQSGSLIYALPQTVLDIYVNAEEVSIIPGPYARYAEKYLGIQNAPSKAEKIYNIRKLILRKHLEADPDFIYTVNGIADPLKYPGLTNLLKDSLILSAAHFSGTIVNSFINPVPSEVLLYRDLSVKRNFEAEKDIDVSMVMPDSGYRSQPRSRTVLKEKTLEQKAEEAANLIIKLKKRRFKLVAGQYDYMPDGESMEAALKELARIEEEYLSLFIGKMIVNETNRVYHFTPAAGKESDRVVLFRFALEKGYVDARETSGIPVLLELESMKKTKELEKLKTPLKHQQNTLPYRIADQVHVRLLAGEKEWVVALLPIFQAGAHISMNLASN
jgi:hypothetical protein